jgi:hypothetical protein
MMWLGAETRSVAPPSTAVGNPGEFRWALAHPNLVPTFLSSIFLIKLISIGSRTAPILLEFFGARPFPKDFFFGVRPHVMNAVPFAHNPERLLDEATPGRVIVNSFVAKHRASHHLRVMMMMMMMMVFRSRSLLVVLRGD